MTTTLRQRSSLLLPLVALLACTTGCLFGGNTATIKTGNDVSNAVFAHVTPGATSAATVRETLGEPSSIIRDGPSEVWEYDATEHVDSNSYFFLIFKGSSSTDTTRKAFVEVKDGIVVRKWRG